MSDMPIHTSDTQKRYEWHTNNISGIKWMVYEWLHTNGIRMTYEWHANEMGLHNEWHASTYDWHNSDTQMIFRWHRNDKHLNTNDIRVIYKWRAKYLSLKISLFFPWYTLTLPGLDVFDHLQPGGGGLVGLVA